MSEKLLYDIVPLWEWPVEETTVVEEKQQQNNLLKTSYELSLAAFRRSVNVLRLAGLPYQHANSHAVFDALSQMRSQKQWSFSISPNCNFVAIFQTRQLEIRCLDEDFSITGTFALPEDCKEGKGVISWEHESNMLAAALGNGTVCIFDTACTLLCAIELSANTSLREDAYNICSIILMPARNQEGSWHMELVVILNSGLLLNHLISTSGAFQLYHTFNFGGVFSKGITCALMDLSSRLLVVGGNTHSGCINEDEITGDNLGITKWRILSDYPFYKKDLGEARISKSPSANFLYRTYSYTTNALQRFYATPMDGVYAMSISPEQNKLVAVHFNGSMSLWDFPSLRMSNIWMMQDQPCHNDDNPSLSSRFGRKRRLDAFAPIKAYPFDISWWNNDAVIISRCSGGLTILSVTESELMNMFGDHCEWVTPCTQISPSFEERFYLLECHKIPSNANKRQKLDEAENEEEESTSFVQRSVEYIKEKTGIAEEKLKERNNSRKYSLLTLTKTTPQELYERKINDKEFGEALSIAQAYNLDCDKVFQRQWRNAPISRASIQDYLSKVKNQLWVFRECMERVPGGMDDMKELIEFALSATDIDRMAIVCNPELEESVQIDEMDDYHGFDYNLQQQREIDKRQHFVEQWKKHVDFTKLTLDQNEMVNCRRKILRFKDRLSTYILLHGGYDASNERYTSDDFATFRKRDFFHLALEYSHSSKWESVDSLLQYHYDQLQQHWLPLLSNFPETLSPSSYSCLLPEVNGGQIVGLIRQKHRSYLDWCEEAQTVEPSLDSEEFYDNNPNLIRFRTKKLTPDLVSEWYQHRAKTMEKLSHMTEEALHLIEMGIERGATGLSPLQLELKTLDDLLFECGVDLALNLDDFIEMSPLERIRLMMAKSVSTTYIRDIQRFVMPFVKTCSEENLFQTFQLETAREDLTLCFVVFKHMFNNKSADFDFKDSSHVINTALDCLYAKENPDQLDIAGRIMKCLPRLEGVDKTLQEKVALMEKTLECCRMLSKHKNPHTAQQLRLIAEDQHQIVLLFKRVARSLTRSDVATTVQYNGLLDDMKSIASKMFSAHMDQTKCLNILIESLLASGIEENIRFAGDRMIRSEIESSKSRASNRLPYADAVALVLSASREYFDAASISLSNNKLLQISKLCLLLITDHPPVVQEQLDLIEAVHLLALFGLEMLPLEVRLCKDRLEIVEKVLNLSPTNYLKLEQILTLASLLKLNDISKDEQKGRTLCLVANKALENDDFKSASSVLRSLIDMNYSQCWKLCAKLAKRKENSDLNFRYSCMAFASCYCDDNSLLSISNDLCSISAALLEQDLEEQVARKDQEELKNMQEEPHNVPSLIPGSHTLKTSAQIIAGTVNATTEVFRSGWSMLKSDPHQSPTSIPQSAASTDVEDEEFENQSAPNFYQTIVPNSRNDLYDVISGNKATSSIVMLQQQTMLRINALAGMHDRTVENLKSLAILTLPHDLPLALSYLLAISEMKVAEEIFMSLPLTSLSLQLQVYYYSLQALSKHSDVSTDCLSIYRAPPSLFIDFAIKHCDVTAKATTLGLHQAVGSLIAFTQGEKLSSLCQDVDMARCLVDPAYTKDVVHGLAMTTNEEQLLVAILLAEQRSCDIWQVALAHVEHLFTETDAPVNEEQLFDELNRLEILSLLVSRGKELYERFDTRVFPLIDGRDHSTLLCYFKVLKECNTTELKTCESVNDICNIPAHRHVAYLQQVMKIAPGLDYKLIISKQSSHHILSSLQEHLQEDNVVQLTKLITSIPYQNQPITESSVMLQWTVKQFWLQDEESLTDDNDWTIKLNSCCEWLVQLNAVDLRSFFEELLYSEKSIENFSYNLRGQFLSFALKFLKTRTVKKKGSPNASQFANLKSELEKLKSHFAVFSTPFMKEVITLSERDKEKYEFLKKFDTSRSELNEISSLAVASTYESVQFTKRFLAALPHLRMTFENVLGQCSHLLIQKLSEATTDLSKKSALSDLSRLLSSIEAYQGKEKKRLFNQVVSIIQEFCNNEGVNIAVKIEVLQLLRKSAALSKNQAEFLLYHRTSELLVAGWGEDASKKLLHDVENISKESFQLQLIKSLTLMGNSFDQVKYISSIADLLTQDSSLSSHHDEMWLEVLTAYAQHSYTGGEEVVAEAKKRKFSINVSRSVFDILSLKSLVLSAVKFLLITRLPPTTNDTIQKLLASVTEIDSSNCDDELLRLLIDYDRVVHTVSTLYYHRVVKYLTEGNYQDADHHVDRLVRQLQDLGFISEAATLLLRYRGSHTVFATFGTSMSLISNWLKRT